MTQFQQYLFGLLLLCGITLGAHGADWHQFLGPDANGISSETGLANEWPDEGPKVLWSFDLGEGFGAPAIADGKAYILDRAGIEQDVMRCLDINTGEELWSFGYDAPGRLSHDGSRSVPLVHDGHVYSVGPFGDVYCISLETHQPVWNVNLTEAFGGHPPNWGFSHSPVLHGDKVIVTPMSEETGVVALHKQTGEVEWKSPNVGGDSYVTPIITTIDGVEQIVFLTSTLLSSIDPESGELNWKWDGYQCRIPIPAPTPLGDGKLFVSGGYGAGSVMIELSKDGDDWTINELFRLDDNGSQIHQVALYEDHLYANFNTNENLRGTSKMGLVCLNLEGDILWSTVNDPEVNRGGFIIVDGKIIALGGENGILFMLEATPEKINVIDSALMFPEDDTRRRKNDIWAPLALSNGKLLIRDQFQMKSLDVMNP